MRVASIARGMVLLALGALVAACAAAPMPDARGRHGQTPSQTARDSQACGWEAQDASGYQLDLSPDENTVYNLFAYARPGGASERSDPRLGRGGKTRYDQLFSECMNRRGYDLFSARPPN
jgi:hypothetical protein